MKEKLFISADEHANSSGGFRSQVRRSFPRLPWNHCALTFVEAKAPVLAEGFVFDLVAIVPYIRSRGTHPVTGAPLTTKDLVRLHFHRTADGKDFCCPISHKTFSEHSKIVAIKSTGNVFSFETVDTLNVQQKHMFDLIKETPFTRSDIIVLQDPTNTDWLTQHDVNTYAHVRNKETKNNAVVITSDGKEASNPGGGVIRLSTSSRDVLTELEASEVGGKKRPRPDDEGCVPSQNIIGLAGQRLKSAVIGTLWATHTVDHFLCEPDRRRHGFWVLSKNEPKIDVE